MEIRSFNPGDAHVSSSIGAWVNYFGAAPDKLSCLKTCEEEVQQTCIIVDGSDDWCSPAYSRPQTFVGDLIPAEKIIAWYHSGISGITKSGFIIRHSDLKELWFAFIKKYPGKSFTSARVDTFKINAARDGVENLIKPVGF
jgi:hypothetical protein